MIQSTIGPVAAAVAEFNASCQLFIDRLIAAYDRAGIPLPSGVTRPSDHRERS